MRRMLTITIFLLLSTAIAKAETSPAPNITYLIKGDGGRIDWSDANHLLVFDKAGPDGYFKIWTMDENGNNQKCLTCNSSILPNRHHGNPAWHPSGEYLAIQVVDPAIAGPLSKSNIYKLVTNPGSGAENNIWIINKDGSQAWQITKLNRSQGVLHPHFSPDGSKLIWAEKIDGKRGSMGGNWVMKIADFSINGKVPQVSNEQILTPGHFEWYETHGFSPDGSAIIFTGMKPRGNVSDFDLYTYNLKDQSLVLLTDPNLKQWDEHAHFTPDGKNVIWMSSMGTKQSLINPLGVKTDYWIMNSDGTDKKQLTFFNHPGKRRVMAADLSISGDGKYMFGYIIDSQTMTHQGSIIRMDLK